MFTKKTDILTFFSQNWFVNLSEYIRIFSDFFLIFEFFFFSFDKTIKINEIWIYFRKILRTRLEKFLNNLSKRFVNTNQTFFNKQGLDKLEKKSGKIHMYSDELKNQFWLKKSYVTGFFVEQFFFTNFLITFENYSYVKSMFSAPYEWLIF